MSSILSVFRIRISEQLRLEGDNKKWWHNNTWSTLKHESCSAEFCVYFNIFSCEISILWKKGGKSSDCGGLHHQIVCSEGSCIKCSSLCGRRIRIEIEFCSSAHKMSFLTALQEHRESRSKLQWLGTVRSVSRTQVHELQSSRFESGCLKCSGRCYRGWVLSMSSRNTAEQTMNMHLI